LAVLITLTLIPIVGAKPALAVTPGMISFRFDDGTQSQYQYALPILRNAGFAGTDYLIINQLDSGSRRSYMDWDQAQLMYQAGWEIGSHSKTHSDLTTLSDADLETELRDSKAAFDSHGIPVTSFVSPYGASNAHTVSHIAKYYQNHSSGNASNLNSYPFSDYNVTVHEILNTTSLATVQGWIGAAASSGKWLVIIMHGLVTANPATEEYTVQDFQSIVDYVKASNIPVVTISQGLTLANPNPNLVANPSFESTAGGWADSWVRSNNNLSLDTSSNGCAPYSTNSVSINGSSSLRSSQVAIDPGKTYLQKAYFNCQSYTSGRIDLSIEEFRSDGTLTGKKTLTSLQSQFVGYRNTVYNPSANTSNIRIVIDTASGSELACYIDNLVLADASGQPGGTGAAVILGNLNQVYDGQPKPVTYTTNPGGLTALITYNGSAAPPTNAGSYAVMAVIASAGYTGSTTGTLTIAKVTPAVTWNNPADITYGTALSSTQLNASANVGGAFGYTPAAGAIPNAGAGQILNTTFTPADTVNYATVNKTAVINVNKAGQTIAFSPLANKTYGDADFPVTAAASSNLPVTFTASGFCTISGNTVHLTGAGSATVTAHQAGNNNYNAAADVSQSFTIGASTNKTIPAVTWSNPADITYGTALSSTQLNASANVIGAFSYTPAAGAILNAGAGQILNTTFTPADTVNYATVNKTEVINVNKAGQTITFSPLANKTYGDADFLVAAAASSNLPVTYTVSGNCTISGNTVHLTGAGSATVTAHQAGNNNYNAAADVSRSFTIIAGTATPGGFTAGGGGSSGGSYNPGIPVTLNGFQANSTLFEDSNGSVKNGSVLITAAGDCNLYIPFGTRMLNSDSKPLANLSAMINTTLISSTDKVLVLAAYDFGPTGATFSPAITLNFKFDMKSLPAGVKTENLKIAVWDGSQWFTLDSQVDAANSIVSASIFHFSSYAIIVDKPVAAAIQLPSPAPTVAATITPQPLISPSPVTSVIAPQPINTVPAPLSATTNSPAVALAPTLTPPGAAAVPAPNPAAPVLPKPNWLLIGGAISLMAILTIGLLVFRRK
jgi:peptidoglycan/xylan/chitin deacetylase (PgdA/CDA1 family)